MNPKFWGMLGLAMRAGKLACGESKASEIIRSGGGFLILLADDASANAEKRFTNMSAYHSVPLIRPGSRFEIGSATGRSFSVVAAVTDDGFAKQLIKLSGDEPPMT